MGDPYAEIFEYKVLQGIRAELSDFGVGSQVVKLEDLEWWSSDSSSPQRFILELRLDSATVRVWLDGKGELRARNVGDAVSVGFDLSCPSSISSLFEFMGVQ